MRGKPGVTFLITGTRADHRPRRCPLAGALLDNPQRVGKPLARELAGYHSARRGAYRVVYRIDERARTVHVVRIDHRADVYRTR
jgi:mRNA-degrading endonuclease RelE of RelBE toxin-antitoxin system